MATTVRRSIAPRPFEISWSPQDSQDLWAEITRGVKRDLFGMEEKLQNALCEHLEYLWRANQLTVPVFSEHVDIHWLREWQIFIQTGIASKNLLEPHQSSFYLLMHSGVINIGVDMFSFHDFLTQKLTTGNFFSNESLLCANSGLRLFPNMKNWQPEFQLFDPVKKVFSPISQYTVQKPSLASAVIDFPSGEVYVSDRIPSKLFNEWLREKINMDFSFNSLAGCVSYSHAAAHFGVATTFVGNTSVDVLVSENAIELGYRFDEDAPEDGFIPAPSFDADIWWSVIVDKKTVRDALMEILPPHDVEEELEKIEQEVIKVSINPGRHHFYFAGRPDVFDEQFAPQNFTPSVFSEKYCMLSSFPLDFESTPPSPAAPARHRI